MRTFAFVFARGGSKGLPGKNIKLLGGVPLIGHSIRCAQQHPLIERVFVSTDCLEIASVAEGFGAQVIQRPPELATDSAPEWAAWQHAIHCVQGTGLNFERFISLPATSPLRSQDDVSASLDALTGNADVVITVTPSARSPYFNMVTKSTDGTVEIVIKEQAITRRQDAPDVYDITTVAYVARPDFILECDGIFQGLVKAIVVPKERAVDIDDKFDFMFAETLLRCQEK